MPDPSTLRIGLLQNNERYISTLRPYFYVLPLPLPLGTFYWLNFRGGYPQGLYPDTGLMGPRHVCLPSR